MKAKLVRTLFNNNSPLNKSGYLEAISLDGEPIKGYLLYTWEGKGLFALDGVSEKELSTELFQRFSSKNNLQGQPSSYTGCGVSNPNKTPVNVLLQFFNLQGDFIDSVQKTIPAHSQLPPETIRDLCPSAEGLEGLIRIKSDSPITGMVCRLVGADSDSGGKVDGANFDGNPSYTLNFPKVVKGKHPYTILAPEVSSTLYIINTEEKSAKVRIIQYDKDGTTEKIIDNSLSGLETIVMNSSDLKIDDGFVKVESNRKLIGGQEITDKDYTVFAYSPAIKTPAVGILEDLVREAPLASADVYFQDKAGNLISSSKGKPEFLIPENTERIRLIKNGFYTHETDVSTYDTPDYIYKLITNDTNLFDMEIYDGSWRTDDEKEMHKWCAGDLKGVYVDISTTHAPSLSSIPQEWINIELDAINKVKEVYPELFLNAQVVVGKNPPLHKNELTGYTRIDRGWFWGYWDDSAKYSAYNWSNGDNVYEINPRKGEKIISGGNQLGTKTFYLPRTYLEEISQCLLGAGGDILNDKESLFSDLYPPSKEDFSYYDLQCIKLMRNRPVGHTTANVPAIGSSRDSLNLTTIKDCNPPRN